MTPRLDPEGFADLWARMHSAKGWNPDTPQSRARMQEYWRQLAYLCTVAELAPAVDRCLREVRGFPEIADLASAVREARTQPTLPFKPKYEGTPATTHAGGAVSPGFAEFAATWRRIRGEAQPLPEAQQGDAYEPGGEG